MKTITLLLFVVLAMTLSAQNEINLSFTGNNNGEYQALDSVLVKNMSQYCDTVIVAPDTSLQLLLTGVNSLSSKTSKLSLSQNFPNPFQGQSRFVVNIPEKTSAEIIISGMSGRKILHKQYMLDAGTHTFLFSSGNEKIYFVRVLAGSMEAAIKMISLNAVNNSCRIEHMNHSEMTNYKNTSQIQDFSFSPGDELLLVGYSTLGESGELKMLESSYDCIFQFASNIPCPGLDSLLYNDQWYSTIQVFNQCWFRENLNAGEKIASGQEQADNGIIEKYCFMNNLLLCETYGGMYCWDEMMAHSSNSLQGICPEGWHVPTDMDWNILEGAVDSQYGIGDPLWNNIGWRGADAGSNLKEEGTLHWWDVNTGTDTFLFTALPGGYFVENDFWGLEYRAIFWSSDPSAYIRVLDAPESGVRRKTGSITNGHAFSIRCLKDQN